MSFLKELELAGKKLRNAVIDNSEDRAARCFKNLAKNNIEFCKQDTGVKISNANGIKIDQLSGEDWKHGNQIFTEYCLREFAKQGYIDCSKYPTSAQKCLSDLANAGRTFCNSSNKPIAASDLGEFIVKTPANSPAFLLDCQDAIIGITINGQPSFHLCHSHGEL